MVTIKIIRKDIMDNCELCDIDDISCSIIIIDGKNAVIACDDCVTCLTKIFGAEIEK